MRTNPSSERRAASRQGLSAMLFCLGCHGSAPAEVPRFGAPPELPYRSTDALAVGLPASSSVDADSNSSPDPAPSEQETRRGAESLPLSADAAQADDLVFLVPSALPEGATVLHIGDSFAGALGRQLNRELARRGVRGVLDYKTGTYIVTWASKRRLAAPLARYHPDLVLITLGANELDIPRPESRANLVRKLVTALGGRPCVWIAPPLWEGAKADVLRVIEANCAPCAYLDSTRLVPNLERLPDQVHPSNAGRARWARAVMTWLDEHPIGDVEPRWVSLEP
jgi:hypothetical protein